MILANEGIGNQIQWYSVESSQTVNSHPCATDHGQWTTGNGFWLRVPPVSERFWRDGNTTPKEAGKTNERSQAEAETIATGKESNLG